MSLLNILRDPIWQFVSVFLGIIGIAVGVISLNIAKKQYNRKEITYKVVSDVPILRNEDVADNLQVLYNNKALSNSRLVVLEIWNSGNVPILPSDYVEPIVFDFGEDAEVLQVKVMEALPTEIKALFKKESGRIFLQPLLLNRKDTIKFKVIAFQSTNKIEVRSRIAGVTLKEIVEKVRFPKTAPPPLFSIVSGLTFLIAGLLMLILLALFLFVPNLFLLVLSKLSGLVDFLYSLTNILSIDLSSNLLIINDIIFIVIIILLIKKINSYRN